MLNALIIFNVAQAFEISSLQVVGPETGLAAQLGQAIATAVEADVERQVTSAVAGKKQVGLRRALLPTAGPPRSPATRHKHHRLPGLVEAPCYIARLSFIRCLQHELPCPVGSPGVQTAVAGPPGQRDASADSSHERRAHPEHEHSFLTKRQVPTAPAYVAGPTLPLSGYVTLLL